MKTRYKVITAVTVLVVAGAGYGVYAQRASATNSLSAESAPTTTLPSGTPVGFNASKTEFVLPHNLGYLPAPELALAKADSAYASGLANAGDWVQTQWGAAGGTHASKLQTIWVYAGAGISNPVNSAQYGIPWNQNIADIKTTTLTWNSILPLDGAGGNVKVIHSTPVSVHMSTLNPLGGLSLHFKAIPAGDKIVAANILEVQAAPVGQVAVNGTQVASFCVSVPEAIISNGKVVTPKSLPLLTAGPSTVFAGSQGTTGTQSNHVELTLYDKGASTCNNFN